MLPKLNPKRALFVLTKIDEILAWEKQKEAEHDTRFVDLGRYLCEVRAGQYWRLENLTSFDEFLHRRFPDSRRTAYYLMSIHEHLPPQIRRELKQVGWTKAAELTKVARSDGKDFDCAAWMHKARNTFVNGQHSAHPEDVHRDQQRVEVQGFAVAIRMEGVGRPLTALHPD